jgi:PAS domain S-box-containing protein
MTATAPPPRRPGAAIGRLGNAPRAWRPLLLRYGIALPLVALAALVHWALLGITPPFLLLVPAVVAVAWYGGLGPGVLATALGTLVAAYFFLEPRLAFRIDDPSDVLSLALFGSVGLLISLFSERLRQHERLRRQAEERALLETEDSLRESRERLRAVVETAADAILTVDERGIIDSVNPAAERMFGYRAAEMVGRDVRMLMPFPGRGGPAREKGLLGLGREIQGRRKDGSTFPADLAVSAFRSQDRPMFAGVLRDASARRQLEREVLEGVTREQRRIGQALHDSTGQELTALGLLAEALSESLQTQAPAAAPLAAKVAAGLRRVLAQVRAYSRGLTPVEVDSRGLLAALAELADSIKEILPVHCTFDCPEPVEVDDNQAATHLYHIAQEAVTNALRHGRPRHITIGLEADAAFLVLRVRDDGVGLPPRPADGKGLGLKIMRYRAGLIQARLTVERAEPAGTLVTCTLARGNRNGQAQAGSR